MRVTELMQQTTDETRCPYTFDMLRNIAKKEDNVQYFYNINVEDEGKRRNDDRHPNRKRQKVEFDQNKCWFCLSSPEVEKHLVISVGDSVYLALAKGGLVDEHLLIIPTEHHQCTLSLPGNVTGEINKFKSALVKYFKEEDKVPIFFERNFKTSHCQINVIPIPEKATREIVEIFKVYKIYTLFYRFLYIFFSRMKPKGTVCS